MTLDFGIFNLEELRFLQTSHIVQKVADVTSQSEKEIHSDIKQSRPTNQAVAWGTSNA
jgi:hypothetical protein